MSNHMSHHHDNRPSTSSPGSSSGSTSESPPEPPSRNAAATPRVGIQSTSGEQHSDPDYAVTLQRVDVSEKDSVVRHVALPSNPAPPPKIERSEKSANREKPEHKKTEHKKAKRGPDPITQSLGLLATMAVMLLVARFVVPTIVEEIRYSWHRGELRAEYEMGTDGLKNVSLDALSDAYGMVTAAVGPSVVHIDVKRRQSLQNLLGDESLIQQRFPQSSDQGSGIVVDMDGYILTNSHVVSGGEDITVTLSDGRRKPAVIVGIDPLTDLALLKVDATELIPITWGDSDACKVGSPVWAVGSPFGLDRTITFGIISGKHRKVRASTEWQDFMQSDVAVNPGNSGGPLVDARGTLVGVNTAIVGDTYQGVSFSVPSNTAKKIYQRLRAAGKVDRGWLGVSLASVSDDELVGDNPRLRGAIVDYLPDPSAPAAIAGIQMGDLITHVDGIAVRDTQHLMQLIGEAIPLQSIQLGIHRLDQDLAIDVTLGARPELSGR